LLTGLAGFVTDQGLITAAGRELLLTTYSIDLEVSNKGEVLDYS
jgi:hypothetical protein